MQKFKFDKKRALAGSTVIAGDGLMVESILLGDGEILVRFKESDTYHAYDENGIPKKLEKVNDNMLFMLERGPGDQQQGAPLNAVKVSGLIYIYAPDNDNIAGFRRAKHAFEALKALKDAAIGVVPAELNDLLEDNELDNFWQYATSPFILAKDVDKPEYSKEALCPEGYVYVATDFVNFETTHPLQTKIK